MALFTQRKHTNPRSFPRWQQDTNTQTWPFTPFWRWRTRCYPDTNLFNPCDLRKAIPFCWRCPQDPTAVSPPGKDTAPFLSRASDAEQGAVSVSPGTETSTYPTGLPNPGEGFPHTRALWTVTKLHQKSSGMVQAGHGTGQSKTISGVGHSLLAGCLARGKRIVLFYFGWKTAKYYELWAACQCLTWNLLVHPTSSSHRVTHLWPTGMIVSLGTSPTLLVTGERAMSDLWIFPCGYQFAVQIWLMEIISLKMERN